MDLVDEDQADELRVGAVAALARDDVPLLGRGDDELRLVDLLLGERRVARELVDRDAEGLEAVAEVEHHLLYEGLHRRDVDDLEGVEVHLVRVRVRVRVSARVSARLRVWVRARVRARVRVRLSAAWNSLKRSW